MKAIPSGGIRRPTQHLGEFAPKTSEFDKTEAAWIVIDENVDVALGLRLVAGDGAEQMKRADTERGRIGVVATQSSSDVVPIHITL